MVSVFREIIDLDDKPVVVLFVAMSFDPTALDEMKKSSSDSLSLLPVKINDDFLTRDLKKKDPSNRPFWLLGQPDIRVKIIDDKMVVKVKGYDYFDVTTGKIDSGGTAKIVMWMLDINYDGKSICPRQVFFPMKGSAGQKGWRHLADILKSTINAKLAEKYESTTSIPFEPGDYNEAIVKIIDDRGVESIKLIDLGDVDG